MDKLLSSLTEQLQRLLSVWLPELDANGWWDRYVMNALSYMQRQQAEQRGISQLNGFDLAALLRILDQNWFDLANHANLPKEARNWLKESQSIRNRWAHIPSGGFDDETIYRDFDTIERLQEALGVGAETLEQLRQQKRELMAKLAGTTVQSAYQPNTLDTSGNFKPGDVVRLKAQPTNLFAIITHLPGNPEDRYQVFHDGVVTTYYASQIELAAPSAGRFSVKPEDLHAAMTALQLRHPSTSHLYSLFASRINFVPYQFRPVLKLIQADRPRLLIADEVGVGKTIEAGLILKELQARREIRSVLIICPKPLVAGRKWLEEMKRFDEQFIHLDSSAIKYCIEETHLDGTWPQQYARAILPYSLLDENLLMGKQLGRNKQRGLLDLDPPPAFDLVIVDEAHHIHNTDTWAYRNVRYFCDNAEAVLLLSATPIQLGDNDLYNLLHLLRPDVLPDRQAFDQMAEPNPYINSAIEAVRTTGPDWKTKARGAIDLVAATTWGRSVLASDPNLQYARDSLDVANLNNESRLALIRHLEELYTFSPLINRTRRRDIGSFTLRKPESVAVPFTSEQESLHSGLINLIARILAHRHGDKNLMFMLTTVRRQVASCVFGLAPLLKGILHRHLSQIDLLDVSDDEEYDDIGDVLADYRADVDDLIRQADSLSGQDPKFDAFLKVIKDKQKQSNNKLLVFSTFRHTLNYLIERLSAHTIRIGLIHGDVPDDERRELRHRFSLAKEDPQALDVLLSSEVGCEGLDFQFCDGMVNYDLPWNPMRIEQRIGRIDRYGQKSEAVVIYNLITPGTVDAEIYERCLLRIGVFRQALGGSEEILGRLTREIHDIAENLALSPDEQASRLKQLADNEIRTIQEQAKLEEAQAALFGLSLPRQDEELVKYASSFWLAPVMLANLVERYLEQLEPGKAHRALAKKPITTIQLGQEIRERLLADFQTINIPGATAQSWQRWLKGNDPYFTLTFDAATAADRRDIAFITPTHPLARQAVQVYDPAAVLISNVTAIADDLPQGRHPYAIYRWRKLGIKEDFTFQPVCANSDINNRMLELLESACNCDLEPSITFDEESALEQTHYRIWSNVRAEHIEQLRNITQSRLTSLETTHVARIALLEEQRDSTAEPRIRRMKEAQIESANMDYKRRVTELRLAATTGDIIAEAVVFGVIVIQRGV